MSEGPGDAAELLSALRDVLPAGPFDRALVLDACASTQDEALAHAQGRPGLIVAAGVQSRGRGRLGRAWVDERGLGLAITFVLPAHATDRLSIAAGVAARRAAESLLPSARLGLRWPNDVVERDAPGRKLAGVLIEARAGLALVGIGLNVAQSESDWPTSLAGRAVSLRELGSSADRALAAGFLVRSLAEVLAMSDHALALAWREADVLVGTRRVFVNDGVRHEGLVVDIEPTSHLVIETPRGRVRLPASTTSLLVEDSPDAHTG